MDALWPGTSPLSNPGNKPRSLECMFAVVSRAFALGLVVFFSSVTASRPPAPPSVEENESQYRFLPSYHFELDVGIFGLRTTEFTRRRRLVRSISKLEYVFFSFRDRLYSVWGFDVEYGMGKTPGDVVFDPMDLSFAIDPAIELRLPGLNVQAGLDHRCFHEIDRDDFPTVYWNSPFVALGTENMRLREYWRRLTRPEGWTRGNRFSAHVRWNTYLRRFFGLVSPHKLNGENDRLHEVGSQFRYAIYRRRSWIVLISESFLAGVHRPRQNTNEAYWRSDIGIECCFRRGTQGAMLYCNYTLDDMPWHEGKPRFSDNGLVRLGVRLY
jgi:hypothetical protein